MRTPTVGDHLARVHDVRPGFLTPQSRALRRALALQAAPKPLRDRMRQAIPWSARSRREAWRAYGAPRSLWCSSPAAGRRRPSASATASPTNGVSRCSLLAHPTTLLAYRSTSTDGDHQPSAVQLSVPSPPHATCGAVTATWRSSRCGAPPPQDDSRWSLGHASGGPQPLPRPVASPDAP